MPSEHRAFPSSFRPLLLSSKDRRLLFLCYFKQTLAMPPYREPSDSLGEACQHNVCFSLRRWRVLPGRLCNGAPTFSLLLPSTSSPPSEIHFCELFRNGTPASRPFARPTCALSLLLAHLSPHLSEEEEEGTPESCFLRLCGEENVSGGQRDGGVAEATQWAPHALRGRFLPFSFFHSTSLSLSSLSSHSFHFPVHI